MKDILVGVGLCLTVVSATAAEFYVSPNGVDTNPGTKEKPFQTLEAVRDAGRKVEGPVTIILRAGTYVRTESFKLDDRDSGTTFKAATGESVQITGGYCVPASSFKPVTGTAILNRLPGAVLRFFRCGFLVVAIPTIARPIRGICPGHLTAIYTRSRLKRAGFRNRSSRAGASA